MKLEVLGLGLGLGVRLGLTLELGSEGCEVEVLEFRVSHTWK